MNHATTTPTGPARAGDTRADMPIRWALIGSLVVNVASLGAFALPGQDNVPLAAKIGAVLFAAIALAGAWGLSQHRRWGARTTIAVTALNVLSSLGGLVDPPSASLAVTIVVGAVIGLVVVTLLRRPVVRASLR